MAVLVDRVPRKLPGSAAASRPAARLGLAGVAFAVSYALGSVLGLQDVAAVAALTVLGYAGVGTGDR